ncbi:hypothetical protein K443DRAFT_13420 [Laccaria amethystina LaAM-08-1]|uniref:Uncharacterized protein n=1 Tax=Laccaria amethystina LaAM-08-1 TaxID=1095629 RepID=A0A0C9WIC1_9AGAR|nr:hypothetical protein K443DRAFT_13420 [Laccaria amethystina LaAM-08-1]
MDSELNPLPTTIIESSDAMVEVDGQKVQGLDNFNLEQRLNNSATSTTSPDDHHRTNSTPRYISPEACLKEWHIPTESSSSLTSSEPNKLSPGAPIHITGTMASTRPTNLGLTTRTEHGSFSENNPNFDSNLNTPLNLNYVVRDEGLNAGTNSASDADGGSCDLGSLRSVEGTKTRGSDPAAALCTSASPSNRHGLNPQRGSADFELPNIDFNLETATGPGPGTIANPETSNSNSSNSSSNGSYSGGNFNLRFISVTSIKSFCEAARLFMSDTLPRLVYHNLLLLRLPVMYSSRVARMAGLEFNSHGEGRGGVGVDSASGTAFHGGSGEQVYPPGSSGHQGSPGVSGAAPNGFDSWQAFIDLLLKEWKTLNVVSAVLTSTILAILQIPKAADDLITRSTGLLLFICALMSLLYGYIYIVRFGIMRILLCAGHAQIERRNFPMLDLGAINNTQQLSSTIPSNNGDAVPSDGDNARHCHPPKCHVAIGDVATRRQTTNLVRRPLIMTTQHGRQRPPHLWMVIAHGDDDPPAQQRPPTRTMSAHRPQRCPIHDHDDPHGQQ